MPNDKPALFYLLRSPLPATVTPHLLGRIVYNFANPTDEFVPKQPSALLDLASFTHEDKQTDASLKLRLQSSMQDSVRVGLLRKAVSLSLNAARDTENSLALSSPLITTRFLESPRQVFDELATNPGVREKMVQMLHRRLVRRRLFFVSGIMTFSQGTTIQRGSANTTVATATADASSPSTGLMAAVQPTLVGALDSVGAATTRRDTLDRSLDATIHAADGEERVFAVQYRVVSQSLGMGCKVRMRTKGPTAKACLFGSDDEDDDEGDDEGDDEEDDEGDDEEFDMFDEGLWDGFNVKLDAESGLLVSE